MRERTVTDLVYTEPATPAPKDNPTGMWMPKHYTMNPDLERLLLNGRHLENGMLVLVEPHAYRGEPELMGELDADPEGAMLPEGFSFFHRRMDRNELIAALDVANQWCVVTDLEIHEDRMQGEPTVAFIGVYYDGTQKVRHYGINVPWLVRDRDLKHGNWLNGLHRK